MADRDLYEVLGVPREASQEDIRKAYRRLAREYHPDVSQDPQAEHRIKEINLAYQTLSDPARRRQYDMFGGQGFTPEMFGFMGDVGDIFEAFFGSPFGRRTGTRRRSRTARGADVHASLTLTFEDAAFGAGKEVEIEIREACDRCGGTGAEPGTHPSRCTVCGGSGEVSDVRRSVFGTVMTSRACATCRGTGQEVASPCRRCGGDGRVAATTTVAVEVPPGVSDGMELRVEGRGHGGRQGGPSGDLYITLHVEPHAFYQRRGQDLVATVEVPVVLALLGTEMEVHTLDGPRTVRIPPGTRTGDVFRLRGQGAANLGRRGRGDILLQAEVVVPERLSRTERALVEELAGLQGLGDEGKPIPGRLRHLR